MKISLYALVLLYLMSTPTQTQAQVRATPLQKYSEVLDLVFRLRQDDCRLTRYRVTLRFLPSFQKESQIVICQRFDGETFAFDQSLSPSDGQVWVAVIRGGPGSKERPPDEIARDFHVQTNKCDVTSDVAKQWMQEILSMELSPPPFDGKVMMDGVGYELVIEAGTSSTRVAVQGPREDVPLISWMKKIRKVIDSTRKHSE